MYYMYVLQSLKNNSFYVGSTKNLKVRFKEHNSGNSIYTNKFRPWNLIYYETYLNLKLAMKRESSLKKRSKAWQELCKRLEVKR